MDTGFVSYEETKKLSKKVELKKKEDEKNSGSLKEKKENIKPFKEGKMEKISVWVKKNGLSVVVIIVIALIIILMSKGCSAKKPAASVKPLAVIEKSYEVKEYKVIVSSPTSKKVVNFTVNDHKFCLKVGENATFNYRGDVGGQIKIKVCGGEPLFYHFYETSPEIQYCHL